MNGLPDEGICCMCVPDDQSCEGCMETECPEEPEVDIEKFVNGVDADVPEDAVEIAPGNLASFTYQVSNPGDVPLSNVIVTDDQGTPNDSGDDFNPTPTLSGGFNVGDTNMNALLDPGEVWLYSAFTPALDLTTVLDFENDGVGNPLFAGTVIDDEYQALGVTISATDFGAMIFDSANPTGGDFDLGTPNQDFGGPGVGAGGAFGADAANDQPHGNILIISEDGDSSDPDDNANGGTITFDFDSPVTIRKIILLDIKEEGGQVSTTDSMGNVENLPIPVSGANGIQRILINRDLVISMAITLAGEGAIVEVQFDRIYRNVAEATADGGASDTDPAHYFNPCGDIAAPNFDVMPASEEVDCSGAVHGPTDPDLQCPEPLQTEIPPVPDVTASDDMDDDVDIDFFEIPLGTCPGVIVRTWVATDCCENQAEMIQLIVLREACVLRQCDWRERPEDWLTPFGPVTEFELGCAGDLTSAADALLILNGGVGSSADATVRLVRELIATILNVSQGADDTCAAEAIQAARDFLCVVPVGSHPAGALEDTADELTRALAEYNCGDCCAPACPDATDVSPVITCPADIIVPGIGPIGPDKTGTASCAGTCELDVSPTHEDSIEEADCPDGSVITRTWTCADGCGNDSTCQQIITRGDEDSDGDGTLDCHDHCPFDVLKVQPGFCGCQWPDVDTDGDGTYDCPCFEAAHPCTPDGDDCAGECVPCAPEGNIFGLTCELGTMVCVVEGVCGDFCPSDPDKLAPGFCGCSAPDVDSDGDGVFDCVDGCPSDGNKTAPGVCGCGLADTGDHDGDGHFDCVDACPDDPGKWASPGFCGCGEPEAPAEGYTIGGFVHVPSEFFDGIPYVEVQLTCQSLDPNLPDIQFIDTCDVDPVSGTGKWHFDHVPCGPCSFAFRYTDSCEDRFALTYCGNQATVGAGEYVSFNVNPANAGGMVPCLQSISVEATTNTFDLLMLNEACAQNPNLPCFDHFGVPGPLAETLPRLAACFFNDNCCGPRALPISDLGPVTSCLCRYDCNGDGIFSIVSDLWCWSQCLVGGVCYPDECGDEPVPPPGVQPSGFPGHMIGGLVYADRDMPLLSGVSGILIEALDAKGAVYATWTNESGVWVIDGLDTGTYTLFLDGRRTSRTHLINGAIRQQSISWWLPGDKTRLRQPSRRD